MMARSTLLGFALALGFAVGVASAAPEEPARRISTPPVFFVSGNGWGHGVGMSQYGAFGFAQRGADYRRILAHYYRGTRLGAAPVRKVRVLLRQNLRAVTIASDRPFTVRDYEGEEHVLRAGSHSFGPGLKLRTTANQEPTPLTPPIVFTPGTTPLRFKKPYRGTFELSLVNDKLRLVNVVGLEAYLYGVVPDEMPEHWPAEALKAQAVVARSYALASRRGNGFDLYSDVRSQVYNGIDAEEPTASAAVAATAGQVLTYAGRVVRTYYHSTSGGRTASAEDVWGMAVPYLVSVPDPYDSLSPHHRWGPFALSAAKLDRALKVPGRVTDIETTVNASGRVDAVIVVGSSGGVTIPAAEFRRRFGLRSTWFRVGLLSLTRLSGAVTYGSEVELAGVARNVGVVFLEQRASSSIWEPAVRVRPDRDDAFRVRVAPLAPTQYRLAALGAAGPPLRVPVAPAVRLRAAADLTALRGFVRPVFEGAPVVV
jgi:stage II sporulation protein D